MSTRIFLGVKDDGDDLTTFMYLKLPETPKATKPIVGLLYFYYMEQKKTEC
jgi:hypothetical protein